MKKKILIIGLTERMGGVESFIYNTTRNSNKDKYEYDFLVHGTKNPVFKEKIDDFYGGKNHFFFVSSFRKHPLKSFIELFMFYRTNGSKYDFVHLQTGATSEVVYVFPFCFIYSFKVIIHSHNGNGYSPFVNSFFKPLVNIVSEKKLSCSDEASKWLFGKRNLKNVKLINNGIDTDRFTFKKNSRREIRNKYNLNEDTIVIGHIGRFSEQKNHAFILEVFKEILKLNKSAVLMLIGVGELENKIKKQAENLDIYKKVLFCGLQNRTEDFYSAFDVFIMPSLYEGLPIVGVEAQCEGLPCFFSKNISCKIGLTDNAKFLDLNREPSYWANEIVRSYASFGNNRENYAGVVKKTGFSISNTVWELENIYEVSNG